MRPDDGLTEAGIAALVAALPSVYLCGPIAEPGAAARGGYQACNRRTIDALRACGVDVRELPFPHPHARGARKWLEYAGGFVALYRRVLRCEPGSILHLTALSAGLVYPQWVLVHLARRHGLRIVFDQRAGGAKRLYETRSALYRRCYASMVRAGHACLVEGEEFMPFLRELGAPDPVHLPNHLDTDALPPRDDAAARPAAPTLVYVGRVVAEKGIEEILDTCRALVRQGVDARLQVAGDGDPAYLEALRRRAAGLQVEWLGPRPAADVVALLARAHFFVFPTRHRGEGQSNALTEAMACGCVPVASPQGFNRTVIGPAGATLPAEATAEHYAARLLEIWRTDGAWHELSRRARRRARSRFSTRPVVLRLLAQYHRLVAGDLRS